MIDSVLRKSGLQTGLFTSPHLISTNERIKINGKSIDDKKYFHYFDKLKFLNDIPPFFGYHTLMAGLAFQDEHLDCLVIEVGIGGRFDWTRIFDPTLTVVTRLEYDHLTALGSTAESITWHKTGICKQNIPTFSVPQQPEFDRPLRKLLKSIGSELIIVPPYFNSYTGLKGPTAQENTSLGVTVAEYLISTHFPFTTINSKVGAIKANILGRYQELIDNYGQHWLLDGAHTPDSMLNCKNWYLTITPNSNDDVVIFTTTKERDPQKPFTVFNNYHFREKIFIKSYSNFAKIEKFISVNTLQEAISLARSRKPRNILTTGSLHLVGDVLGFLKSEEYPIYSNN